MLAGTKRLSWATEPCTTYLVYDITGSGRVYLDTVRNGKYNGRVGHDYLVQTCNKHGEIRPVNDQIFRA